MIPKSGICQNFIFFLLQGNSKEIV